MQVKELFETSLTTATVSAEIRAICKHHQLQCEISKTQSSIRITIDTMFGSLTKDGKKLVDDASKREVGVDIRYKINRKIVGDDGVDDRCRAAVTDMQKKLSAMGVKKMGRILPTPGTSGFGGYGVKNNFDMQDINDVKVDDKFTLYPIFKFSL